MIPNYICHSYLVRDIDGAARQITEDLINRGKTKLLLIGTRQMLQNTHTDLDLHGTLLRKELRPVVSAKDLGVYMDATLSFDEHITSVTSSCLSSSSQINRVKHLLDRNTFILNVINALVFSKLYYCLVRYDKEEYQQITEYPKLRN